jgi:hypothetical protein
MNVLFVAASGMANPFIERYAKSLTSYCEVTCSIDDFWNDEKRYDVIHIHWPEALLNWESPNLDDLNKISNQLNHWLSNNAKVVVTRHNIAPHKDTLVYSKVDAVLHFAKYSILEFKERYKNESFHKTIAHAVIPHGNYITNHTLTKKQSRKHLSISNNAFVITALGHIRSLTEKDLILKGYKHAVIKNKFLLVPRWVNKPRPSYKKEPFSRLWWELELYYNNSGYFGRKFGNKILSESELAHYISATDVLLIPRTDKVLNSGNLYLGFSWRKVVVGPNIGNIGEILSLTGNPTFDSNDISSVAAALEVGVALVSSELPQSNYDYALYECSWEKIASLTFNVYRTN